MPPSLEQTLDLREPSHPVKLAFDDTVVVPRSMSPANAKNSSARRTYSEEPLPFKPSQVAPRNARITGRVAEPGLLPAYTLEIGDVQVDDVGLDEILDYVSPYDLEQFENRQFQEERNALAVAQAEYDAEQGRRQERRKIRAKFKGAVAVEEIPVDVDSESGVADSGRHGRARPTYKHLFKQPDHVRRRRKRDPTTGELLPLSDGDERIQTFQESSDDENVQPVQGPPVSFTPGSELVPRRRRKRDPVTGELMPLEAPPSIVSMPSKPELHIDYRKRPRRKRHPITGELMPLGWRYSADLEGPSGSQRSPSTDGISNAHENGPKRRRLAYDSSTNDAPQPRGSPTRTSPRSPQVQPDVSGAAVLGALKANELARTSSSSDSDRSPERAVLANKASMLRPILDAGQGASDSSTEEVTLASFLKTNAAQPEYDSGDASSIDIGRKHSTSQTLPTTSKPQPRGSGRHNMTSIMNPIAALSDDNADQEGEDEDESEDEDGEFFVEAIVGHRLSDPKTHPGKERVMLYHTKWEGYDQLTWEPAESFGDPSTIAQYRKKVGLDRPGSILKHLERVVPIRQQPSPTTRLATKPIQSSSSVAKTVAGPERKKSVSEEKRKKPRESSKDESKDDESDDGWEIQSILAHHMSDPRTHPGKPQTMLYQVKWVGYEETTWEPIGSFPDRRVVNRYRQKVGLKPE